MTIKKKGQKTKKKGQKPVKKAGGGMAMKKKKGYAKGGAVRRK